MIQKLISKKKEKGFFDFYYFSWKILLSFEETLAKERERERMIKMFAIIIEVK